MNIQHQNLLQEKENDLLKEDEIRVEQELGKGQRIKMKDETALHEKVALHIRFYTYMTLLHELSIYTYFKKCKTRNT